MGWRKTPPAPLIPQPVALVPISPLHLPTCATTVRNYSFFLAGFLSRPSVYTEYIEARVPVVVVVHRHEQIFEEMRTTDSLCLQPMFNLCLYYAVLAAFDLVLG